MVSCLYKNNPKEIEHSSSGGAFRKIVSCIGDDKNTVVYGAVWDDNLSVIHSYLNWEEDLQSFSGSKYARSKMGDIFSHVLSHLLQGKTVIFSGTPCQIEGLNQFLKVKNIDTRRLYLIDIICHGTPSPVILKDWIESVERKYKHKITSLSFRDKDVGWMGYPTKVVLDNGKIIRHSYKTQEYIRLFFTHVSMAPSCYECPFANMDRKSDITIGDFWGVENSYPDVKAGKGVSLVLFNTEKGIDVLKKMRMSVVKDEILIECPTNSFLQYQHNLNRPTERPQIRDDFWRDYNKNGYNFVIKKYKVSSRTGNLKFDIKKILSKLKLYKRLFFI